MKFATINEMPGEVSRPYETAALGDEESINSFTSPSDGRRPESILDHTCWSKKTTTTTTKTKTTIIYCQLLYNILHAIRKSSPRNIPLR